MTAPPIRWPRVRQTVITRALAHGTSQSGRYLRDFVYSGFNEDEAQPHRVRRRQPARRDRALLAQPPLRPAQPDRQTSAMASSHYPDVTFPFAYETADRSVHRRDATAFWRAAPSAGTARRSSTPQFRDRILADRAIAGHHRPLGQRDVDAPDNVRIYHFAGTQHIGRQPPCRRACARCRPIAVDYGRCCAPLVSLDRWVKDGTPPPASRYPRIDDGTLIDAGSLHMALPGMPAPTGAAPRPRFDYGARFATAGIFDRGGWYDGGKSTSLFGARRLSSGFEIPAARNDILIYAEPWHVTSSGSRIGIIRDSRDR